ncbi:hypothetical protein GTA08_BOTSDO01507 [Neofusicoccum parvum]|uniref:Uncharacterized protein n=1 Tax=Neofusicoccum parvum TaxID=310453 RepID=A0ACB5SA47_9PEZI|nr:hypothetical protein GTA08_BOTSDO01507 [Neofusicoccum parvum]
MVFKPSTHDGTVHHFSPGLIAFEHKPATDTPTANPNTLIWLGGLGDGLLTVPYATRLAARLPANWTLAQPILSSAYGGWGTSSVGRDADELARLVAHLRRARPGARVALMGHSTGCQDAVEYVCAPSAASPPSAAATSTRPPLDAVVLQAPVSDREALVQALGAEACARVSAAARAMVEAGRGEDVLPFELTGAVFQRTPVAARRWLSLASPEKRGAEDFFSSDLPDEVLERTFGRVPRGMRVCVLYSGADEFVPRDVDKAGLIARWKGFVGEGVVWEEEFGGIVEGASHNLKRDREEVVEDLCRRVVGFLKKVEKGDDDSGAAHL